MTAESFSAEARAPRRVAVAEHFRNRIVRGELAPGARLPSYSEMAQALGACKSTVQDAMDELKRDGFLEARERSGVFVAERPPHLCHYAVVVAGDEMESAPAFATALRREADTMRREKSGRLLIYADVAVNNPEYFRLLRDMEANRVAGLIFQRDPRDFGLAGTPVLMAPGMPRVAITAPSYAQAGLAVVWPDFAAFARKATGYLAARGRRRLACLLYEDVESGPVAFREMIPRECGLSMEPEWYHVVPPRSVRNVVRLLMRLPESERPDALLVVDDNLVEQASLGLLDAGVRIGEEIDVVGHCNYSSVVPSHVRMKRLGWDDRELLRVCMKQIDRMRAGEAAAPPIAVEPLFDHEMRKD